MCKYWWECAGKGVKDQRGAGFGGLRALRRREWESSGEQSDLNRKRDTPSAAKWGAPG